MHTYIHIRVHIHTYIHTYVQVLHDPEEEFWTGVSIILHSAEVMQLDSRGFDIQVSLVYVHVYAYIYICVCVCVCVCVCKFCVRVSACFDTSS
jgi:hypothetical protein